MDWEQAERTGRRFHDRFLFLWFRVTWLWRAFLAVLAAATAALIGWGVSKLL